MLSIKSNKHIYYGLIDCNNFYASCEEVFNPQLVGKAIVVLSNNDGCIIARSAKSKEIGIPMGIPYHECKDIIRDNDVEVYSSNYQLYGDMSHRVMQSIKMLSQHCEIYSIDEAFITIPHCNYDDMIEYADNLCKTIKQWTGISVSIGIGQSKTLAKLANRYAKKQKQAYYFIDDVNHHDDILKATMIDDIWGVGGNLGKRLKYLGLYNAYDFKQADPNHIRQAFSVVLQRTLLEIQGISCLTLDDITPKKSITVSRSFARQQTELHKLDEAICHFVARACVKLRQQKLYTNALSIKVKVKSAKGFYHYYYDSYTINLPHATHDTIELCKYAKQAIGRIYKKGNIYLKARVLFFDLSATQQIYDDLFIKPINDDNQELLNMLDHVNYKFGKGSLFFANQGVKNQAWQQRRHYTSPRYTTNIKELCVARAN